MTQKSNPRALFLGGLDPSGGAGITVDGKMAAALGVYPLTIATCLTVQNRHGFQALHNTNEPLLRASLAAVIEDGPVHAIKIGLVANLRSLDVLLDILGEDLPGVPVLVDPVLSATSGGMTTRTDLIECYRRNLSRMDLLTPNLDELAILAPKGGTRQLLDLGCKAVLSKGGHAPGATIEDRLVTAGGETVFRHPRLDCGPVRGTGCGLGAAVTSFLARGLALPEACQKGVETLTRCLTATEPLQDGLPVPLAFPQM